MTVASLIDGRQKAQRHYRRHGGYAYTTAHLDGYSIVVYLDGEGFEYILLDIWGNMVLFSRSLFNFSRFVKTL